MAGIQHRSLPKESSSRKYSQYETIIEEGLGGTAEENGNGKHKVRTKFVIRIDGQIILIEEVKIKSQEGVSLNFRIVDCQNERKVQR